MTSTFAYNQQQSNLAFASYGAMNFDEFVAYAEEALFGESTEYIYETISQCQSEINLYGDSGPGTMLRLSEIVADFNRVADRYTKLTGQIVQRPRMPVFPFHPDTDFDDWNSY